MAVVFAADKSRKRAEALKLKLKLRRGSEAVRGQGRMQMQRGFQVPLALHSKNLTLQKFSPYFDNIAMANFFYNYVVTFLNCYKELLCTTYT